jgi:anti-sigma regulatory factor (Ser/Thr protein kinase)
MYATWTFPPEIGSVREARACVRDLLDSEGASADEREVAALLVSELVSNAVVHPETTTEPIGLTVRSGTTGIYIEVQDHDPSPPMLREEGALGEHGAGLRIVSGLSLRWGWEPAAGEGKHVWCELGAPRGVTG